MFLPVSHQQADVMTHDHVASPRLLTLALCTAMAYSGTVYASSPSDVMTTDAVTTDAMTPDSATPITLRHTLTTNINANQPDNIKDPWMHYNRTMFNLNKSLDKYTTKPLAKLYLKVVPEPVDKGITQFLGNLYEPWSAVNHLLQGSPFQATKSLARFVINTTSSLGFYDTSKKIGLLSTKEDLGQTFAVWGIPSGPYMMLPFFGPSTLRDTVGLVADRTVGSVPYHTVPTVQQWSLTGFEAVDLRADLMPFENLIQGDQYSLIRDVWLRNRQADIVNGAVINEPVNIDEGFGDDSDVVEDVVGTEASPQSSAPTADTEIIHTPNGQTETTEAQITEVPINPDWIRASKESLPNVEADKCLTHVKSQALSATSLSTSSATPSSEVAIDTVNTYCNYK